MRVLYATVLLVALACERGPAPAPRASASVAPAGPSPGAKAVASLVASVRARELTLAAPGWQLQTHAFGRNLYVRLAGDGVEAYSMPDGALLFQQPLDDARGVVEIAGGSIVVVGPEHSLRIDPGGKMPVRLPPIPFLPGTVLVPDRRDSSGLWSVHTVGHVLARHVLDISGKRRLEGVVRLADHDGGPVTAMRDGSLLYRAPGGVRKALPGGRAHPLKSELVPWRLLAGRRVDQAWAVSESGAVELWQIGERILVTARHTLGLPPFDAASSSRYFAAVVVEEGKGKPRRFRLVVLSEQGDEVLREDLPEGPPPEGDKWASIEGRNRQVALADSDPLVAVGGPRGVRVLRIPDGTPVLAK